MSINHSFNQIKNVIKIIWFVGSQTTNGSCWGRWQARVTRQQRVEWNVWSHQPKTQGKAFFLHFFSVYIWKQGKSMNNPVYPFDRTAFSSQPMFKMIHIIYSTLYSLLHVYQHINFVLYSIVCIIFSFTGKCFHTFNLHYLCNIVIYWKFLNLIFLFNLTWKTVLKTKCVFSRKIISRQIFLSNIDNPVGLLKDDDIFLHFWLICSTAHMFSFTMGKGQVFFSRERFVKHAMVRF